MARMFDFTQLPIAVASKVVAIVLLCTCAFFSSRAQERVSLAEGEYAFDFRVFFPVNIFELRSDYMENPRTLAKIDSIISVHGTALVDSVKLVAYSSPEGDYDKNMTLAENRAKSMRDYLVSHYPDLDGRVSLDFGVSPWPKKRTSLRRLRYAAFRLAFPYDITVEVPEFDYDVDIDWSVYDIEISDASLFDGNVSGSETLSCDIPGYVEPEEPKVPNTIFALKTNLLYDLVSAYNIEVEVPIADRWSVVVEDVWPWWEWGNKYCLQMWEMGLEARFWFKPWETVGTDKLRGFFAGAYGMTSKYDFQFDTNVDYQGEYWSAGLTGGWSTVLGRSKRCRLELSLALGFLHSGWRHYYPTDIYDKLIRDADRTGTLQFWGPTKAKVSLVIPINVKTRKRND